MTLLAGDAANGHAAFLLPTNGGADVTAEIISDFFPRIETCDLSVLQRNDPQKKGDAAASREVSCFDTFCQLTKPTTRASMAKA